MKAKDVMSTKLIHVTPSTSLEKAIQILVKNDISGLPVVGRAKRLVGIVTEEDLMLTWHYFNRKNTGIAIKDCHVLGSPLVIERVITVTEDTPVGEIIKTLIYKRIKRVPVVKEGRLVGIVSRRDILKQLIGGTSITKSKNTQII